MFPVRATSQCPIFVAIPRPHRAEGPRCVRCRPSLYFPTGAKVWDLSKLILETFKEPLLASGYTGSELAGIV